MAAAPSTDRTSHVWRARRARYGELVQWDTSEHDWLEGRGEKLYLIGMIDDATSQLSARFVRQDSTEENLRQLRDYIEQHGRPVAVYTDKASLFQIAPRAIHPRDAPEEQLSQIDRALKERWPPSLVRSVRAVAQSTDLASHERNYVT
jgi:hypothetical protein